MVEVDAQMPPMSEAVPPATVGEKPDTVAVAGSENAHQGSAEDQALGPVDQGRDESRDQLEGSPVLQEVLGPALEPLQRFHHKLVSEGLTRGIIGPRDASIIWERHILNSAAARPFLEQACQEAGSRRVADVGSGGGFPGIVLAACMPDYDFTLIEPMERRIEWLNEVVDELSLRNVHLVRKRVEDIISDSSQDPVAAGKRRKGGRKKSRAREAQGSFAGNSGQLSAQAGARAGAGQFAAVTCRAVAPLTKLAAWTLPLVQVGGQLVALKGRSAQAEIDKAQKELRKCGGREPRVVDAPVGPGLEPTHVVLVNKV
ncbi:ribosomal RNA small subunit methyltransferase G [Bombiscardovia nodaiensis]|uniref:Ribosomal RNA small subunit methyltransferase G n=1 Tax=Bombiscardovia nodaiensis TaxID=2932181 RepID=A0ABM8BAE0_9BIFI|nr:ribosomal RNA small subunit methyltransferase G [Bombiscardovia nodaiensis]